MFKFTGYNLSYLEESRRRAETPIGKIIYYSRWNTVTEFCRGGSLLDYGCGAGAFHEQAPEGFAATGWDVNPTSPYHDQTLAKKYDILTMWDVIEHLPAPLDPVFQFNPTWVFICTPNAENTDVDHFRQWKHFKPVEHLHYYTPATLAMSMRSIGYALKYCDYTEGRLRDDSNPRAIFTAVFQCCANSS